MECRKKVCHPQRCPLRTLSVTRFNKKRPSLVEGAQTGFGHHHLLVALQGITTELTVCQRAVLDLPQNMRRKALQLDSAPAARHPPLAAADRPR